MKELLDFAEKRMDLGLERIKKAMKELGWPTKNYNTILIAGTNGKGSTTSYLSNILKEAGYRVGSFYSPHLVDWKERIRINNEKIKEEEAKKLLEKIKKIIVKNNLTYFEAMTALAYSYFKEKDVDYAVVEVGLGGRWDATNIAEEKLNIITRIGKDHMHILGKSIEEIAKEKAEIIKKGNVIANNKCDIFRKKAENIGRKAYCIGKEFGFKNVEIKTKRSEFDYYDEYEEKKIRTRMIGFNQVENASEAIKAALLLKIKWSAIEKGIKKAKISGRFEIRKNNVVIDVAHNVDGIKVLRKNIDKLFKEKKIVAVFGAMKDKEWKKMLKILNPEKLVAVEIKNKRSEKAENIAKYWRNAVAFDDVERGYEYALEEKQEDEIIVVCGSIYIIGELYRKKRWRVV